MELILIATDGSQDALAAVRLGADMADRYGARVLLLHAIARPTPATYSLFDEPDELDALLRDDARRTSDASCSALEGAGVEFETVIVEGSPAEEILRLAEERDVDLIVLGHRGLTKTERFFLGSVTSRVVHETHRAVLLAPVPNAP